MDLIEYLTELLFSLLLPLLHAVWQLLVPPWLSAPARDAQRQQVEEEATERALATGAAPSTPLPVAAAAVSPAAAAPSPVRFRQATAYVAWLQQCAQQEYQAALAVASTAQLSCQQWPVASAKELDNKCLQIELEPAATLALEAWEVHYHVIGYNRQLYLATTQRNSLDTSTHHRPQRGRNTFDTHSRSLGLGFSIRLEPLNQSAAVATRGNVLYDLGYVGNLQLEREGCDLLAGLSPSQMPPLLLSLADPRRSRRRMSKLLGDAEEGGTNLNASQLRVVRGLTHDIELVQGPPGSGKSTVIQHIVACLAARDQVVLVTCIQNKAVDVIAAKLASSNVSFMVMGQSDRLGPTARRHTFDAQLLEHAEYAAYSSLLERLRIFCTDVAAYQKNQPQRHAVTSDSEPGSPPLTPGQCASLTAVYRQMAAQRLTALPPLDQITHSCSAALQFALDVVPQIQTLLQQAHRVVRTKILASTRAILCTLAVSAGRLLRNEHLDPLLQRIQVVIVDEASTVAEPSMALLLQLPHLQRLVLIGDDQQLPPFTNLRDGGAASAIEVPVSVFTRLRQALSGSLPMLQVQYRMHPDICNFVSREFYSGRLQTAESVARERIAMNERGLYWTGCGGGNSGGGSKKNCGESQSSTKSLINRDEAAVVAEVVAKYASTGGRLSIVVATFYRAQAELLAQQLILAGCPPGEQVHVMTVDQTQGSEADIVILSCVRSNPNGQIGFLNNMQRLNVALSRARHLLVIVGDARTLTQRSSVWRRLHQSAVKVTGVEDLPRFARRA